MTDSELKAAMEAEATKKAAEEKESRDRAESRYQDLIEKLKMETAEKDRVKKEAEELKEQARQSKFDKDFLEVSMKFPNAKDFRSDIETKVKENNLGLEEATTLILAQKNKLVSSEDSNRRRAESKDLGGSMDTSHVAPSRDKSPREMSVDELVAGLRDAESKGEFRLA